RPVSVRDLRSSILEMAVTGLLSGCHGSLWPTDTLGTVAESRLGKMLDKAKNRGTPRPYLRNTNIHWFSIRLDDIKTMLFEDDELSEYELRAGDILVCEGGHGIGRAAVWNAAVPSMMFQKALHRVRPGPQMDSNFLA